MWSARERPVVLEVRRAGRVVMVGDGVGIVCALVEAGLPSAWVRSMGLVVDEPGLEVSFFR